MFLKVILMCLVASAIILLIKKYSPENALTVALAAVSVILLFIIISASDLFSEIRELFDSFGIDPEIVKITLKALGICYLTGFAADVCRDFGQTSLASKVELAGKVTVVILTLPFVKQILRVATELME